VRQYVIFYLFNAEDRKKNITVLNLYKISLGDRQNYELINANLLNSIKVNQKHYLNDQKKKKIYLYIYLCFNFQN